jgi:hypothetical protein
MRFLKEETMDDFMNALAEREDSEASARKVTATIDELYKDRSNEMGNEVVPDPVADMIAELQA